MGNDTIYISLPIQKGLCITDGSFICQDLLLGIRKLYAGLAVRLHIVYRDAAATKHEITYISFGLGDGCLLFMALTWRPKQQGEARLHEAVRRLSSLCLVGSWQTATNLTDSLSEC